MREDLEELFAQEEKSESKRKALIFLKKIWWLIAISVLGGIYVYFLFFGDNTFGVLAELKKQKAQIEDQVLSLQNENVELQKVIFELRGLEPNFEERR